MPAYLELLTVDGYKYAFIKKHKRKKKSVSKLKIVKRNQWLSELPSDGLAFTIEPT